MLSFGMSVQLSVLVVFTGATGSKSERDDVTKETGDVMPLSRACFSVAYGSAHCSVLLTHHKLIRKPQFCVPIITV